MADFAPELPNKEPNEYLKMSQGWQNRSVSTLFSGLGDIMKLGVTAADDRNKREVRDEVRAAVDETQDRSIAELHYLRDFTKNIPPEIKRDQERLKKFKEAAEQGSLRESNYWSVLDSTARRLRAKYPGYRDHIDAAMKEFTGSDPANAVIRELRQDIAANTKKEKNDLEKRRFSLIEKLNSDGLLAGIPGWQNMPWEQLVAESSNEYRKKYALEQRKAQLGVAKDQRTFDQTEAGVTASADWGTVFNNVRKGSNSIFAQNMTKIEQLRDQVSARGGFTPTAEETRQYVSQIDAAARDLTTQFQTFLTEPRDFLGGRSYAMTLSQQQVQELKANQLDMIVNDMKTAAFDKDLGFAKRAALMAETYSDTEKVRLLGYPVMRSVAAGRQIVGDVALSAVMQGKVFGEVQDILRQHSAIKMGDIDNPTSLQEQVKFNKDKGADKPDFVQTVIQDGVRTITNKEVALNTRIATVNSFYGPDNETFLGMVNRDPKLGGSRASPQRVFQMMANSRTARAVQELSKETGDPTHWAKYERWVTSQVYALNTLDINTVARAQRDAPGVNIRWDPQAMMFHVDDVDTPMGSFARPGESVGMTGIRALAQAYEVSRAPGIRTAVGRLNDSFAPLRDIAEYKKADKTEYALAVLTELGARAESIDGRESVAQSLLTRLSKVLYDDINPRLRKSLQENISTQRSARPTDTRTPIDITPPFPDVSQGPAARALRWLGETISGALPSREQMDRDRRGDLFPEPRRISDLPPPERVPMSEVPSLPRPTEVLRDAQGRRMTEAWKNSLLRARDSGDSSKLQEAIERFERQFGEGSAEVVLGE